ncbi:MAG: 4Fe-4S dicluster domain-containing protein [Bacillota bacterium]
MGFFIPACMLLGIGIGIFKGRKWCDWLCPRGSFFDAIMKPFSPVKKIPAVFKSLPFRLGVITFLMSMMVYQIIVRWPDPVRIGIFFVMLLTITTGVGMIFALTLHPRTWCCFCPIGSVSNWVDRGNYRLRIDSSRCTECRSCARVCPIQVEPYRFKRGAVEPVADSDCLRCRTCVQSCPKQALAL